MKITQIRRVAPSSGSSNLGGSGGIIDGGGENFGGGFPPSGQVPVATGSNTWAWASNVQLITADGSNKLLSPFVNFASGSNIIFTFDGLVGSTPSNTVRIHSTGSGSGGSFSGFTTQDEGSTLSTTVTTLNFTGAGVSASGGGATTTIDIAGGSSSDDTIPSGGTLYSGTSTSGWTSHNSPDTFDVSTFSGHFYVQETTMGGGNTVGAYRAVGGSFPRTYTMKLRGAYFNVNFHNPQLWVAEASPGKIVAWGPVRDGDAKYLQRQLWTNATTLSTQTNFPGSTGTHVFPPTWLRLVVNSSTDIEGWHSFDGLIYYRYFSAYNPAFTVGSFGFGISAFNGIEMKMIVDWIHET